MKPDVAILDVQRDEETTFSKAPALRNDTTLPKLVDWAMVQVTLRRMLDVARYRLR